MREKRRKGSGERGEETTGANSKMNGREERRREGEKRGLASERRVDKRDEIDERGVACCDSHVEVGLCLAAVSPLVRHECMRVLLGGPLHPFVIQFRKYLVQIFNSLVSWV